MRIKAFLQIRCWFGGLVLVVALTSLSLSSPPRSRGARPIALGNGYTAMTGDVYSLFYNPAGLYELNQKEFVTDFGRSYSENESARTGFNFMFAMPYTWRERYMPLAVAVYGEQAAPGAHIVDITAASAIDAPSERWTKGWVKLPTKFGLAVNFRQQNGEDRSGRVGDSALSLGLTAGLYTKLDRKNQIGFALRHLYLGDGDPKGPSANIGYLRRHKDYMTFLIDMEYASGGIFRFQPGAEFIFYRGVLRPRIGWGYRDNGGVDTIATGLGFYLSPLQIDISYLLPVKTLTDNTGQIRASLSYRFGKPQFTEIYYDQALEAASQLDQNVLSLTAREAELKSSLMELEQKLRLAREELKSSRSRIEALKDQDILGKRDVTIRKLKNRVRQLENALKDSQGVTRRLRKKKATIRTHTVKPGDTLQSLAREYYGDPNLWKKIYNANPDKVDRGLPRPGTKLVIP